jgi:hypothetical protein
MNDRKWFTPTEGLTVIDPLTRQVIPAKGKWIGAREAEFYIRRELDGDGTITAAPPDGVELEPSAG